MRGEHQVGRDHTARDMRDSRRWQDTGAQDVCERGDNDQKAQEGHPVVDTWEKGIAHGGVNPKRINALGAIRLAGHTLAAPKVDQPKLLFRVAESVEMADGGGGASVDSAALSCGIYQPVGLKAWRG